MIPKAEQRRLDRVTPESLARELDGFPLKAQCSIDQFARAIRESLRLTMIMSRDVSMQTSPDFNRRGPMGGPNRQSNVATKQEIADLAQQSADLARRLGECSKEASNVLWLHAFWSKPHENKEQPSDHERFLEIVRQLEWVVGFLGEAAKQLPNQSTRHREAEERQQRIWHAFGLSCVFEWAFGKPATVSSRGDQTEGPWLEFFQLVMKLVFDEAQTPNLPRLLKTARRHYKNSGVLFDPQNLFE